MTISTYAELQTAMSAWSHRSDLSAIWPDCIQFAEARFNRVLRMSDMEEAFASTALVNGEADLPAGFLAWKELRFDGTPNYTLQPRSLEWIRGRDTANTGDAQYFAVTKDKVVCWPQAGSIKGTYYKAIPALASNSTNWLLSAYPDLYLFAALQEAALYMQDDGRIPVWGQKVAEMLDAIQRSDDRDQFEGGIVTVRAG